MQPIKLTERSLGMSAKEKGVLHSLSFFLLMLLFYLIFCHLAIIIYSLVFLSGASAYWTTDSGSGIGVSLPRTAISNSSATSYVPTSSSTSFAFVPSDSIVRQYGQPE